MKIWSQMDMERSLEQQEYLGIGMRINMNWKANIIKLGAPRESRKTWEKEAEEVWRVEPSNQASLSQTLAGPSPILRHIPSGTRSYYYPDWFINLFISNTLIDVPWRLKTESCFAGGLQLCHFCSITLCNKYFILVILPQNHTPEIIH